MTNQIAYIGTDALKHLFDIIRSSAWKRVLLVHGRHSYISCGAHKAFDSIWQELQCELVEFNAFSANPKWEDALTGVALLQEMSVDVIVAVGGGSAIDISKLMRHFYREQSSVYIPLVAVPTTAGTGAEATHFAVMYKDGVKQSVEADDILPDYAAVYPPFTYNNDSYLTACTGFDALAQAIESFWSVNSTEESREYSVQAIRLLWHNLPKVVGSPSADLRNKISEGAYWAGRAINISKTTAPHAFSYIFTSKYGYPHGHAVALTFPFFLALNADSTLLKLLEIPIENVLPMMQYYIQTLGLSLNIAPEVDINYCLQQVNIQRLKNNPVVVDESVISRLKLFLTTQGI